MLGKTQWAWAQEAGAMGRAELTGPMDRATWARALPSGLGLCAEPRARTGTRALSRGQKFVFTNVCSGN